MLSVTCKHCGTRGLVWRETPSGKWRLFYYDQIHICKKKEDEMINKYENCQICGAKNPMGEPCQNCINKNNLKKNEKLVTPENLSNFIQKLEVKDGDIVIFRTPAEQSNSLNEALQSLRHAETLKDVQVLVVDVETTIITVRKENEPNTTV